MFRMHIMVKVSCQYCPQWPINDRTIVADGPMPQLVRPR